MNITFSWVPRSATWILSTFTRNLSPNQGLYMQHHTIVCLVRVHLSSNSNLLNFSFSISPKFFLSSFFSHSKLRIFHNYRIHCSSIRVLIPSCEFHENSISVVIQRTKSLVNVSSWCPLYPVHRFEVLLLEWKFLTNLEVVCLKWCEEK